MCDKSDAQKHLDAVTAEGKEITINVEIKDREKAQQLMATMHNQNVDEFGVVVTSWGFWDIQKAQKLRIEMLEQAARDYQLITGNISSMTDRAILEINSVS